MFKKLLKATKCLLAWDTHKTSLLILNHTQQEGHNPLDAATLDSGCRSRPIQHFQSLSSRNLPLLEISFGLMSLSLTFCHYSLSPYIFFLSWGHHSLSPSLSLSISLSDLHSSYWVPDTTAYYYWPESTITVQPSACLTYIYNWLTAVNPSWSYTDMYAHVCKYLCVFVTCYRTFILTFAARNSSHDPAVITCGSCHDNLTWYYIILCFSILLCGYLSWEVLQIVTILG